MSEEKKNNDKLSYEQLEQVCMNLQNQLNQSARVNELRDAIAVCLELLKHKDSLPAATFTKVVNFLDKIIPVPKDNEQ